MDLGDPNLTPLRMIGQGSFGRVFLCKDRSDGGSDRKVCVKRIIVHNPKVEMGMIKEEVYIVSQLSHPNIVRFIRSFMDHGTVNIVTEYAPNGTLRDVITRANGSGQPIDKNQILHYFSDMLMGIEYLHIRHVIHRDIKPENMLLDGNDRIKIADFGISAVHSPSKHYKNIMGTPLYMAPEIMRGEKFCYKSDVWSMGCVLYELCMGINPFAAIMPTHSPSFDHVHAIIRSMTLNRFNCQLITSRYGPVWSKLCEVMIVYDTLRRISLPDILIIDPCITLNVYRQYFNYNYS